MRCGIREREAVPRAIISKNVLIGVLPLILGLNFSLVIMCLIIHILFRPIALWLLTQKMGFEEVVDDCFDLKSHG